jgi:hypothetical protein
MIMTKRATGTSEMKDWKEDAYLTVDDKVKHTRADVEFALQGVIEGQGKMVYLMGYSGKDARYVGLMRVEGKVDGRTGGFTVQEVGRTYEDGWIRADWTIVEGTGTGDLATLRGGGGIQAKATKTCDYFLEYDLG